MSVVTVYVTFANADEARAIGRTMIDERLAACVNLLAPCTSIYRWEGAVEQAQEVPALFKTSSEAADKLIARLAELHSYDVPAITVWPIERLSAPFADWVEQSLR